MASESAGGGFEEEESESGIQLKASGVPLFADAIPPSNPKSGPGGMGPIQAAGLESKASLPVSLPSPVIQREVKHPGVELHNHFNGVLQPEAVLKLAGYDNKYADFLKDFWKAPDRTQHPAIKAFYSSYGALDDSAQIKPETIAESAAGMAPALLKAGPHLPFDVAYLVREWLSNSKVSRKDANKEILNESKRVGDPSELAGKMNQQAGNFDGRVIMVIAKQSADQTEAKKAGADMVGGMELADAELKAPAEAAKKQKKEFPQLKFARWTATSDTYGDVMKAYAGKWLRPYGLITPKSDTLPASNAKWADKIKALKAKPTHEIEFKAGAISAQHESKHAGGEEHQFKQRLQALGEEMVGDKALKATKVYAKIMQAAKKWVTDKINKGQNKAGLESMMALEEEIGNFRTVVATLRQLNVDNLQYVEFQGSAGFNGGKLKLNQKDLQELCTAAGVELHFLMTLSSKLLGGDNPRKGQAAKDLKAEIKKKGLDGIDFAGAEAKFDATKGKAYFKSIYEMLAQLGAEEKRAYVLRPHAGEGYKDRERKEGSHRDEAWWNVSVITDAVKELASAGKISKHVILRVGHGTHAHFRDLETLQSFGVIIEANLGSNKATGSADDDIRSDAFMPTEKENTILKFLYNDMQTILSTDGGGVIGTTIQREYNVVDDILKRFKNNQIGFFLDKVNTRFWYSEVPELVQDEDTGHTEFVISKASQAKFDIQHVLETAENYMRDHAPRLKKNSMA